MTDHPHSLHPSFTKTTPDGDDRDRLICDHCGEIRYENPKIVVGSVVIRENRILLCRRAIEPRKGFWTLPAGYLELGETPEEGARREAREEALAEIEIDRLLAVYSIPRISQVQLFYRAALASPEVGAGPESLEVGLFAWKAIPWADMAFPSAVWALKHYSESKEKSEFAPYSSPAS